jgi:replicative DNA helicase
MIINKKAGVATPAAKQNQQSQYTTDSEKKPISEAKIISLVDPERIEEMAELGNQNNRPFIKFSGCESFLNCEPKPTDYLFKELVPSNVVGAIFATGGTGKTFLSLQLAGSLATGKPLGIFEPQQKRKVLFLGGEDHEEILHKRIYSIFHNIEDFKSARDDFSRNFTAISLCGEDTVLTGYDGTGSNPTVTKTFDWLEQSIEAMPQKPEVLIIDPKSRFDGLDENNNTHATFFVNSLERLSKKFNLTVFFVHHESKATVRDGNVKNSTGRGASGLRDGVRFTLSLAEISEATAKAFDIDQHDYIECYTSKNNYAAKMKSSAFFKRGNDGVLIPENLFQKRIFAQAQELARLIGESGERITRRGLKKGVSESNKAELAIKSALKEFGVKSLTKEADSIIDQAIERGLIIEKDSQYESGKKVKILTLPDHSTGNGKVW